MTAEGPAPAGRRAAASGPTRAARMTPRTITALVLLVLAVVFVLENRELTEIRLLIPIVLMPLWAALALALAIGLVAGLLLGRRSR